MKKAKIITVILVTALALCLACGAAASAAKAGKLVSKAQAPGIQRSLSGIIDPGAEWEQVAIVESNTTDNAHFIEGMSFDRKGQLWFCDIAGGQLLKLVNGAPVTILDRTDVPGFAPNGSKFHKDGRLFIVDQKKGILAYDPVTDTIKTIVGSTDPDPDFAQLNDLVFDRNGGLYITECGTAHALKPDGKVWYLGPGATTPKVFAENLAYPNGIAVSKDGNRVYIADFNRNQIISAPAIGAPPFPPEVPFVFCRLEGGIGPDGLAVDDAGNLYAAHLEAGEIVVINPMGFQLGTIRLPEGNGLLSTNLEFHDGYLYVTESHRNNIIWRIPVKNKGLTPYGLQ